MSQSELTSGMNSATIDQDSSLIIKCGEQDIVLFSNLNQISAEVFDNMNTSLGRLGNRDFGIFFGKNGGYIKATTSQSQSVSTQFAYLHPKTLSHDVYFSTVADDSFIIGHPPTSEHSTVHERVGRGINYWHITGKQTSVQTDLNYINSQDVIQLTTDSKTTDIKERGTQQTSYNVFAHLYYRTMVKIQQRGMRVLFRKGSTSSSASLLEVPTSNSSTISSSSNSTTERTGTYRSDSDSNNERSRRPYRSGSDSDSNNERSRSSYRSRTDSDSNNERSRSSYRSDSDSNNERSRSSYRSDSDSNNERSRSSYRSRTDPDSNNERSRSSYRSGSDSDSNNERSRSSYRSDSDSNNERSRSSYRSDSDSNNERSRSSYRSRTDPDSNNERSRSSYRSGSDSDSNNERSRSSYRSDSDSNSERSRRPYRSDSDSNNERSRSSYRSDSDSNSERSRRPYRSDSDSNNERSRSSYRSDSDSNTERSKNSDSSRSSDSDSHYGLFPETRYRFSTIQGTVLIEAGHTYGSYRFDTIHTEITKWTIPTDEGIIDKDSIIYKDSFVSGDQQGTSSNSQTTPGSQQNSTSASQTTTNNQQTIPNNQQTTPNNQQKQPDNQQKPPENQQPGNQQKPPENQQPDNQQKPADNQQKPPENQQPDNQQNPPENHNEPVNEERQVSYPKKELEPIRKLHDNSVTPKKKKSSSTFISFDLMTITVISAFLALFCITVGLLIGACIFPTKSTNSIKQRTESENQSLLNNEERSPENEELKSRLHGQSSSGPTSINDLNSVQQAPILPGAQFQMVNT